MKKIYSFYRQLVAQNLGWLYFILILAAAGAASGAATVWWFPQTLPAVLDFLSATFKDILGPANLETGLPLARALLRQNFTASFSNLIFGGILGIIPVFSIFGNFFIIGFLGGFSLTPQLLPQLHNFSFGVFLLSILPHGIFEIPALFLAAAFGLRLGWQWLLPGSRSKRGEVFKRAFADGLKVLPLILLLLIIAALAEAFITPKLI